MIRLLFAKLLEVQYFNWNRTLRPVTQDRILKHRNVRIIVVKLKITLTTFYKVKSKSKKYL